VKKSERGEGTTRDRRQPVRKEEEPGFQTGGSFQRTHTCPIATNVRGEWTGTPRLLEKVEDGKHEKTDDPRSYGHQANRAVDRIFHGGGEVSQWIGWDHPEPLAMIINFWMDSKFMDAPFILSLFGPVVQEQID